MQVANLKAIDSELAEERGKGKASAQKRQRESKEEEVRIARKKLRESPVESNAAPGTEPGSSSQRRLGRGKRVRVQTARAQGL